MLGGVELLLVLALLAALVVVLAVVVQGVKALVRRAK